MPGPLAGVRVVDCTTVVLAPWAAQQLPRLGEHSVEILREAGFSPAEIETLLASGATRGEPKE